MTEPQRTASVTAEMVGRLNNWAEKIAYRSWREDENDDLERVLREAALSLSPAAGTEALREAKQAVLEIGRPVPGFGGATGDYVRGWLRGRDEALDVIDAALASPSPSERAAPVAGQEEPRCDECGREIILDCTVPNGVWHQIATREETLCPVCIDRRLSKKGYGEAAGQMQVEARFSFNGKTRSLFSLEQGEPRVTPAGGSAPPASAVAQIVAWQDMASAPKDGTKILLWWPYWFTQPVVGNWLDGGWWAEGALTGGVQPIAWQPLPPPPSGEWQGTPVPKETK